MKYFIIAGEASGDIHAAGLIAALRKADANAEIKFFGGDLMAAAAGHAPELHYRMMAYMGFSEVLRHLPDIKRNLARAKGVVDEFAPDAVILVDYPSFNLRIAHYAHDRGIKVFYYISPKVWAWKEHRVKTLKRDVDCIYSILPFEREFYRRHGMDVEYVGNPSVMEVDRRLAEARRSNPLLPRRDFIALVPGSRVGEIRNNLPVMASVAGRHAGEFEAVIAGAPSIPDELYHSFCHFRVVKNATFDLMHFSRAALVTSGTATLECALAGTPQVACYRANGSRLAYGIMSRWLKVRYVTLPNLIADREVIPEMLLHSCNPDDVDARLAPLLYDSPERKAQLDGYDEIRRILGTSDPAVTAAASIVKALG